MCSSIYFSTGLTSLSGSHPSSSVGGVSKIGVEEKHDTVSVTKALLSHVLYAALIRASRPCAQYVHRIDQALATLTQAEGT